MIVVEMFVVYNTYKILDMLHIITPVFENVANPLLAKLLV